jgi:ABC-2 type transport system permease protein
MNNLAAMIWIEQRKAFRSRMPLWTALGSLFMPLGIAFLIFVAKNPQISQKLGLISAKANLIAFASADWQTYMGVFGQMIAAGGFVLFVLVVSWVFGREFVDGTLKDMLAVPVQRYYILLAKFIVSAIWAAGLAVVILLFGLLMGMLIGLPDGSLRVILDGSARMAITAGLTIAVVLPFAIFASLGRGYLLPVGMAVLILMLTNLVMIAGWGEYFPWAVAGLFAEGKSVLPQASYWIAIFTCLVGMAITCLWWQLADQNK